LRRAPGGTRGGQPTATAAAPWRPRSYRPNCENPRRARRRFSR